MAKPFPSPDNPAIFPIAIFSVFLYNSNFNEVEEKNSEAGMSKIFISYSHDSQEHCDLVLVLSNRLIEDGLECILDQYMDPPPPEGWPKWMDKQLRDADLVIIICTETYYSRVMDEEKTGKGKGVKWESTLTYQYIYDDDSKNTRFIPVIFNHTNSRYIPTPLKGVSYYCVDTEEGYEELYRRLTNQPVVKKPKKGRLKTYPPKKTKKGLFSEPLIEEDKISLYKLPTTGPKLFGREKELEMLNEAWTDESTCLVTLIAWGGVGKTALVNYWLNLMAKDNYRGARKVYGWSFYSQGAEEGKQASADEFLQETLKWFGDSHPEEGTPVDKGRRLARLVGKEKTLLILDGMEPLQYPPGEVHGFDGKLKDQGMRAFLRELTGCSPGLCVITSRERVTDLEDKLEFSVKEIPLEHLSPGAGALLLRNLGVEGTNKEILKAVQEYGGHALALTLLGNYIKSVFKGDIRKRDRIPKLTLDKRQGRHARRVMEAHARWLGESAERDILYIMGLFDRSVPMGAIESLKADPPIPGVTEQLQQLKEVDWGYALENLRGANLLAKEDPHKPDFLDCHPLIREHFGERFREQNPAGWKEAHQRLYHYFKYLPEKDLPDTLLEMEPLFAAVAHGCKAGLYQVVWDNVFENRICRGEEAFIVKKLGAFGSTLAIFSHFFNIPWSQPESQLSDSRKADLLSRTAFTLRAVGRLQEAIQPMKAGLEADLKLEDWKECTIISNNLSELLLTLGEVSQAVDVARQSVTHSDRSGDNLWKEVSRTTLADALHQFGHIKEAEKWFRETEEMQKQRQPEYPYLYSVQGFKFCDFLLGKEKGTVREVRERAEKTMEWARKGGLSLLAIALDNLSLGRTGIMQAIEDRTDFTRAAAHLEHAVQVLRKAGAQHHLPRGLLARAECYRRQKQFSKAWDDLNEALEIAELGSMKLYIVDYHLEAGRLCQDEGNKVGADEHFKIAAKMIEETGYHRRDKEVKKVIGH
jgi:tetratricopeptide (TPR) repeat protein